MKTLVASCAAALLLVPLLARAAGDPPAGTRALLTEATKELQKRDFTGAYSYRSSRVTSKKNGDDREEREELFEFEQNGASASERTLVRATLNGADITEERREEIRQAEGRQRRGPEMKLPTGEHDLFVFEPQDPQAELCVARFEPKPDAEDAEGITEGRLAWNCASGDPAWLEARFVDNPMMVQELEIRWEFRRVGDIVITESNAWHILAGPPFMKRRMQIKSELVDLREGVEVDVAGGEEPERGAKAE